MLEVFQGVQSPLNAECFLFHCKKAELSREQLKTDVNQRMPSSFDPSHTHQFVAKHFPQKPYEDLYYPQQ